MAKLRESQNRERVAPYRADGYRPGATSVVWRKRQIAIFALVVAVAAAGFAASSSARWRRDVSRGPVATVHAAWNDRCEACHTPPTDTDSRWSKLLDTHTRWHTFQCETCHAGPAGDLKNYAPHHHNSVRNDDCASCHREHQGAAFALSWVTDDACTRCHLDVASHAVVSPARSPHIGRFAEGKTDSHPPFPVVANYARPPYPHTMQFNHAVHLAHDLKVTKGGQSVVVNLDCRRCHQLDAERDENTPKTPGNLPSESVSPPRTAGNFFLPIVFEKHCQECHELTVGGDKSRANVTFQPFNVPHRLSPGDLSQVIRREAVRQIADKHPDALQQKLPPRDRLPGPAAARTTFDLEGRDRRFGGRGRAVAVPQGAVRHQRQFLLEMSRRQARRTVDRRAAPHSNRLAAGREVQPRRSSGRDVFRVSHEQKQQDRSPYTARAAGSAGHRHLPQMSRPCGRAGRRAGRRRARHDCVECHRYHNADHAKHSIASPHIDPQLPIEKFLKGSRE